MCSLLSEGLYSELISDCIACCIFQLIVGTVGYIIKQCFGIVCIYLRRMYLLNFSSDVPRDYAVGYNRANEVNFYYNMTLTFFPLIV